MKFSLFIFIFLFFANCSSRKHTASFYQQTDSLLQTSRLTVQTARIPESRANLSIPVTALKELPAGAAFIQKSGQATAEIRFLHDTLFVAATCDSLQTLVWQYEEQLERQSKQTKEIRKEAERKSDLPKYLTALFTLIIALIILYKFSPHKSA